MDGTTIGEEKKAPTGTGWPVTLQRLVLASVLYLAWAGFATAVAIAQDLPAEFSGWSTGLSASRDWVYGMGTALSPPFLWMAIQALLTGLATRTGRPGGIGVAGVTLIGLTNTIGAAGEPITYEVFAPGSLDVLKAIVQVGMIALPLVMMVFGILEWRRGARARRPGASVPEQQSA